MWRSKLCACAWLCALLAMAVVLAMGQTVFGEESSASPEADPFATPPLAEPSSEPDPFADEAPAEPRVDEEASEVAAVALPLDEETEARIRHVLAESTTLEFVDTELSTVFSFLEDLHKIQIVLDKKALADVGVSSDTLTTQYLREITLQSALELMLDELDLTWVIRNACLIITTEERTFSTEVYQVADLVAKNDDGKVDYTSLVRAIETTIAADSWSEAGGSGNISPYAGTLLIYQSAPVHRQIERLLAQLKGVVQLDLLPAETEIARPAARGGMGASASSGGGQF